MKTKIKIRVLTWLLVFAMGITSLAGTGMVSAAEEWTSINKEVIINPLYEDVLSDAQKQAIIDELSSVADIHEISSSATGSTVYEDMDSAIDYVKNQMVNRVQTINIVVKYDSKVNTAREVATGILNSAMEYTEDCTGQEGDALAGVYSGINMSYSYSSTQVKVDYVVNYRTTLEQEKQLTTAVNTALASLKLSGKTELQKVRAIHDYICDNVDYDYVHLEEAETQGKDYPLMYTAYAALCNGEAVCQGYALLFYRMCKDAGLSVRYITGWGNGGAHAWNIVRIDDVYYNVDSTWDGQDDVTTHNFFLKNKEDFAGHTRSTDYETESFLAKFPTAEDSWEDFSNISDGMNVANLSTMNYTTISNGTINNQATGRPKILVFGRVDCYNTRNTISNISKADFSDVDVVYVDALKNTKENVIAFRDTYGSSSDGIVYTYNLSGTNLWNYVRATIGNVNSVTFPLIVYIDSNNMIQAYQNAGVFSANSIRAKINAYLMGAEKMTISNSTLSLKVYEDKKLVASVLGIKRNGQFLTWTSSNPNVAVVDENGVVTATGKGSATITCKANNELYKTCQVSVNGIASISIKLDKTAAEMKVGDSIKLNATVSPVSVAKKGVVWSSSNKNVATVDQNGNVKAVGEGSVVITGSVTVDGVKYQAGCNIKVESDKITFKVQHYVMQGNGSYSLAKDESLTGNKNDSYSCKNLIKAEYNTGDTYFKTLTVNDGTIAGLDINTSIRLSNGDVVKIYYDRKSVGKFASYDGCDFYRDVNGNVTCIRQSDGTAVINEFKCDGTYTYYFQLDGTAMRDRLTYHPDGVHVIYFDEYGHEVFSNFANVKRTISGESVDDYCFFDVFGYLYVDVVTYDQTGTKLYYANPYGVLERGKWFQFSQTVMCADGTPWNGAAGNYGYANADGTLMKDTYTYNWEGRLVYMQGNGVMMYVD